MHWTSKDEREMIKEWAEEYSTEKLTEQIFSIPTNTASNESYWCKYDETEDITEYAFDTVPELNAMLERGLVDEFYKELFLPLTVAAFKEKQIIQIDAEINEKGDSSEGLLASGEDEFAIPEFVYVF